MELSAAGRLRGCFSKPYVSRGCAQDSRRPPVMAARLAFRVNVANVGVATWATRYALRVSRSVIVSLSLKTRQRHLSPSGARR